MIMTILVTKFIKTGGQKLIYMTICIPVLFPKLRVSMVHVLNQKSILTYYKQFSK